MLIARNYLCDLTFKIIILTVGIYRPTLLHRLTLGLVRPTSDFTDRTDGRLPIIATDNIRLKVCRPNRPILFPTGRAVESESLSGVAADIRLQQGTRPADGVSGSSPDVPAAEYRCIVGQPIQTPYDRYGLLSYQGHAVQPPWGIILSRTWVNSNNPR